MITISQTERGQLGGVTKAAARGHEMRPADGHRSNGRPSPVDSFQPVLTIRARVKKDEVLDFTQASLREIRNYIAQNGIEVQGPPFSICRPASPTHIDVEAGWSVGQARGNRHIRNRALPVTWVTRGNPANGPIP